jgi:hypothetical protein
MEWIFGNRGDTKNAWGKGEGDTSPSNRRKLRRSPTKATVALRGRKGEQGKTWSTKFERARTALVKLVNPENGILFFSEKHFSPECY